MIEEQTISIAAPDGNIPVFVALPKGETSAPAVLLYMDLFGPREELYEFCRRFARNGYVALLHNMFYRRGAPTFEPSNEKGGKVDPEAFAAGQETTVAMAADDTRRLIEAGDNGAFGIKISGYGAIGYCMGGRHALAATARCADRVYCGLSLHGGQLVKDEGFSSHSLIGELTRPFHFAFAQNDKTCPPEHQELIKQTANKSEAEISFAHHSAGHGWSFPERWSYDAGVAEENWVLALRMLQEHIPRV